MEPENQQPTPEPHDLSGQIAPESPSPVPEAKPHRGLRWIFVGDQGLRAGWSIAIFIALAIAFGVVIHFVSQAIHPTNPKVKAEFTAKTALIGEFISAVVLVICAAIVAFIERRKHNFLEYNLIGPHRVAHFFSGFLAGFLALSALVGSMAMGGWLHFGPVALSGAAIFKYAAVWGAAFFFVGCVEEGSMRCFLLATLTRGLNFWWALALNGAVCLDLVLRAKGNGVWGVYIIVLLGLLPCLWLHLIKSPQSGFWQAAWVTSTFFGFGHTSNNGENWIGIFAAAFIGFVFCVSVKVTGSAWWAIGCHQAWDWAETYFYGTADSGFVAKGHFLSTSTTGNPLWSGGTDGPEGSLLVIFVSLLLLVALVAIYGRKKPESTALPHMEPLAG
jgi:CAAX protease family protein